MKKIYFAILSLFMLIFIGNAIHAQDFHFTKEKLFYFPDSTSFNSYPLFIHYDSNNLEVGSISFDESETLLQEKVKTDSLDILDVQVTPLLYRDSGEIISIETKDSITKLTVMTPVTNFRDFGIDLHIGYDSIKQTVYIDYHFNPMIFTYASMPFFEYKIIDVYINTKSTEVKSFTFINYNKWNK